MGVIEGMYNYWVLFIMINQTSWKELLLIVGFELIIL